MKLESDPTILGRRQRQLNYAKNCLGYGNYIKNISRNERIQSTHPQTPNKFQKCSSRSWDGQIKKWKSLIHQWEPPNAAKIVKKTVLLQNNEKMQTIDDSD